MVEGCEPSRHLYQVLAGRRDDLLSALAAAGIFGGVHYEDNTSYRMYASAAGTCPAAARASARLVSLPLSTRLTGSEVEAVCAAVAAFASAAR